MNSKFFIAYTQSYQSGYSYSIVENIYLIDSAGPVVKIMS